MLPLERIEDQLNSLVINEESYGGKIAQSAVLVKPVITFPSANDVLENHFFFGDYGPVIGASICSIVIIQVGVH